MDTPVNVDNTNTQNQQDITPSTGSGMFNERGVYLEPTPTISNPEKSETLPIIESSVEKVIETTPEQVSSQTETVSQLPTTPKEEVTTIHVVDTRTGDTLEHNIKTEDKLSQLADEDENNFIEGVDTAHGKPKAVPK